MKEKRKSRPPDFLLRPFNKFFSYYRNAFLSNFRYEREKMEIERLHNLTEEERRMEMKLKPKLVINKAEKGKYKFLQKYYHRGVFYLVSKNILWLGFLPINTQINAFL